MFLVLHITYIHTHQICSLELEDDIEWLIFPNEVLTPDEKF